MSTLGWQSVKSPAKWGETFLVVCLLKVEINQAKSLRSSFMANYESDLDRNCIKCIVWVLIKNHILFNDQNNEPWNLYGKYRITNKKRIYLQESCQHNGHKDNGWRMIVDCWAERANWGKLKTEKEREREAERERDKMCKNDSSAIDKALCLWTLKSFKFKDLLG